MAWLIFAPNVCLAASDLITAIGREAMANASYDENITMRRLCEHSEAIQIDFTKQIRSGLLRCARKDARLTYVLMACVCHGREAADCGEWLQRFFHLA